MFKSKWFISLITIGMFATACKRDKSPNPQPDPESTLPHIYIATEKNKDINTKAEYINASINIDGKTFYEDYEGTTGIRGRGNSTWSFPKKPYKLKLDSKEPLFGLESYKTWILLAEYLDGTMLYNSIPFKAAEMLGIPYTNTIIPVELTINNKYQGLYVFTEHKQVSSGRINLGNNGVLLELDAYFDEDWQFKSDKFDLPVMVKYPKTENMNATLFQEIKEDFEEFEALVYNASFPNNNYLDYFDDTAFVDYMIVYQLTANREINHPKSTYINKLENGKYRMGIIWDFDWAYGYEEGGTHYDLHTASYDLLYDNNSLPGTRFFSKIMEDPHIQELFKERWNWFRNNKYEDLVDHVRDYSQIVRQAYKADHEKWGERNSSQNADEDLQRVLSWLDARTHYIDTYVNSF